MSAKSAVDLSQVETIFHMQDPTKVAELLEAPRDPDAKYVNAANKTARESRPHFIAWDELADHLDDPDFEPAFAVYSVPQQRFVAILEQSVVTKLSEEGRLPKATPDTKVRGYIIPINVAKEMHQYKLQVSRLKGEQ